MSSLIRATNLLGYAELVDELGGDPESLRSRFHVPLGVEHQPDAFVPFAATGRLLEASANELDCPDFGLRLSGWQGLTILGPISVIARNAGTVQAALVAIARYLYVHSPALELAPARSDRRGAVRFTYRINELSLPELRQAYELSLANSVRIVRLLAGGSGDLTGVSFLHARLGADSSYAEVLGCPVRFEQDWCGFELSQSLTTQRIDAADPETLRIATSYLETAFTRPDVPLAERVAELARRLLPTGQCSTETISEQLAMHPRTLQRRLAADGVEPHELIDAQRRELAEHYLAEPRLTLSQVAGLLGYSEQSSLNRSCRRWFGQTPRQYRTSATAARGS